MNRERTYAWLPILALAALTGCVEAPAWFEFEQRLRPRVFIAHTPLVPTPGEFVKVVLQADVDDPQSIASANASIELPGAVTVTKSCDPVSGSSTEFECVFSLEGVGDGAMPIYSGRLLMADSFDGPSSVRADTRYRFTVAALDHGEPEFVPVREPLASRPVLEDKNFAVKTVLTRDSSLASFDMAAFVNTAAGFIYGGVLSDPAYRWRSNQLAFYLYTKDAAVTDYYSGLSTRCGQNPWPQETLLPAPVHDADVIGVLHARSAGQAGGAESAGGNFRDCAGRVVKTTSPGQAKPPIATFSARSGSSISPKLAVHEFGHAAFGLSDEYNEATGSRRTGPELTIGVPQVDAACCCVQQGDDGGFGPGDGFPGDGPDLVGADDLVTANEEAIMCVGADGQLHAASASTIAGGVAQIANDCATATIDQYPAFCGAQAEVPVCPPLRQGCLREVMWLDATPPLTSGAFDNLFTSEAACESARDATLTHPGVENAAQGMLGQCVQHCGPDGGEGPCACEEGAQYWRVDRNPLTQDNDADTMRVIAAGVDNGGTCARCIETSLCVRWERARGKSVEDTWDYCEAPPENIVELQDATQTLVGSIVAFFRELFGQARTSTAGAASSG